MQPFTPHSRFFSSLDQLQHRLSSEKTQPNAAATTTTPKNNNINPSSSPSPSSLPFSSPLYLADPKHPTASGSCPPLDFLSNSPLAAGEEEGSEDPATSPSENNEDLIEQLVDLLGLSDLLGEKNAEQESPSSSSCRCGDCGAGGEFYRNVVGVKGPRCEKEMKRLDAWIGKYRREKSEPARLAHLLIGKAVATCGCDGEGFEGVEFPQSVMEFLERDSD